MIFNPYDLNGNWFKGNLHTHTLNSPCGHYSVEKVIEMYKSYKMKYDFLSITDHYILTDLSEYAKDNDIILFNGVEFKEGDLQSLGINIKSCKDDKNDLDNHKELFEEVTNQGGINIICHPHVYRDDYWPFEKLQELDNYTGIEIFNNNVKHDNKGRAVATDLWDKLLTAGKKVYGFANDDMHVFSRAGGAFNIVLARERSASEILKSISEGRFYCTTGIYIDEIKLENNNILIKAAKLPVDFKFVGEGGQMLKQSSGFEASYTLKGNEKYVRVELDREDGAKAWTQPFILNN